MLKVSVKFPWYPKCLHVLWFHACFVALSEKILVVAAIYFCLCVETRVVAAYLSPSRFKYFKPIFLTSFIALLSRVPVTTVLVTPCLAAGASLVFYDNPAPPTGRVLRTPSWHLARWLKFITRGNT